MVLPYSCPEPPLIRVTRRSLVMPIKQVRQVAARAHVQSLRDPAQGQGRLGSQLGCQPDFELAAFPMRLQFGAGPALPL